MSETLLNQTDFKGLKEIEQLGKDFKEDYKILLIYIQNIINRFHRYVLKPTLQVKTVECETNITFVNDNKQLYNNIRNNNDTLPDDDTLPDGYTDVETFLTEYDTCNEYVNLNCPDEYVVEFHTNMFKFYTVDELNLIRRKYDNLVQYKDSLLQEQIDDDTNIFNITIRLNSLVLSLTSLLEM